MQKTKFSIQKMDCNAEEQLIRLKLEDFPAISALQFDIPARMLEVYHSGDQNLIFEALNDLQLDTSMIETTSEADAPVVGDAALERRLLIQVLAINLFFFALESLMGFISNSMGLVADSLDMLADSLVYGLALFAVGGSVAAKKNIARISGYFQLILAILGIIEVVRRFLGFGEVPTFQTMIIISMLALLGNAVSLYLLQKSSSKEAHMQASVIFTSNDVIINIGVMIAGGFVFITNSNIPDLIVGAIVFVIVTRGAFRILELAR
jgi:Co/Zn/Cd efflux system component